MATQYLFTGISRLGYTQYVDLSTGLMLLAEPGGIYGMRAVNAELPIPPADGRWGFAPAPKVKPAKAEGGAA